MPIIAVKTESNEVHISNWCQGRFYKKTVEAENGFNTIRYASGQNALSQFQKTVGRWNENIARNA